MGIGPATTETKTLHLLPHTDTLLSLRIIHLHDVERVQVEGLELSVGPHLGETRQREGEAEEESKRVGPTYAPRMQES